MTVEYRLYLQGEEFAVDEDESHEGEDGYSNEPDEVVNPILPEMNEILWAVLFFGALFFAMRFVLVPPIQAAMAQRNEQIRSAKAAADSVESDMGTAKADYDARISAARDEANALLESARADAEAHRSGLQAEADAEIADLRAAADAEIEAARAQALVSVRGDVSQMAVGAASTVIGKQLDVGSQQAVLDRFIGGDA